MSGTSLRKDVRQALGQMRAARVFFAVVILTLGVGIGSNTALFSIVKAVLLEPLPYDDPDRILMLEEDHWAPTIIYEDLQQTAEDLAEVAGSYAREFVLTVGERPFQVHGSAVTPNFFRVFPARPGHGRLFVEADADPGAPRTVVLGHRLWQTRYGGSPDVLDRTIVIDGNPHRVFGVTPTDPFTLLAAVAVILLVTLAACSVPARKATQLDPVVAVSGQERGRPLPGD